MSVEGEFRSMPLTELLQWLGGQNRTGVLEVEHGDIRRRLLFSDGRIVACSCTGRSNRLGRFLISRGKIRESTLRWALEQQKKDPRPLGAILVEVGVISRAEVEAEMAAKAEEVVLGMFHWDDAAFRFRPSTPLDPHAMEVDLQVEELVLRGAERQDHLNNIRLAFPSSGAVLACTEEWIPPHLLDDITRLVLDKLDGVRSLSDVLHEVRASEFASLQRLLSLYEHGIVRIVKNAPPALGSRTLLDHAPNPTVADRSSHEAWDELPEALAVLDAADPSNEPRGAMAGPTSPDRPSMTTNGELDITEALQRMHDCGLLHIDESTANEDGDKSG